MPKVLERVPHEVGWAHQDDINARVGSDEMRSFLRVREQAEALGLIELAFVHYGLGAYVFIPGWDGQAHPPLRSIVAAVEAASRLARRNTETG